MGENDAGAGHRQAAARARELLLESARVKQRVAAELAERIAEAGALLAEAFRCGRRALLFGNGGSAADAQHIAAEWTGRFRGERRPLPALALTTNSSELTCLGNDYGFEKVFSRLLEAHGREGDVAVALSTSGLSPNVIEGVQVALERGLRVIGLLGKDGGKLATLVHLPLVVPSSDTQHIQEAHIAIGHVLCDLVDGALFSD